jgi:hypothetical protein
MAILGWREALVVSLCITIHFIYRYHRKRLLPLPPGPSGWPLIGNALQLPRENMYSFYEELGRKMGSVIYLSLGVYNNKLPFRIKAPLCRGARSTDSRHERY